MASLPSNDFLPSISSGRSLFASSTIPFISTTVWRIPAPHTGESEEIVDEGAGVLDRRENRLEVACANLVKGRT